MYVVPIASSPLLLFLAVPLIYHIELSFAQVSSWTDDVQGLASSRNMTRALVSCMSAYLLSVFPKQGIVAARGFALFRVQGKLG